MFIFYIMTVIYKYCYEYKSKKDKKKHNKLDCKRKIFKTFFGNLCYKFVKFCVFLIDIGNNVNQI